MTTITTVNGHLEALGVNSMFEGVIQTYNLDDYFDLLPEKSQEENIALSQDIRVRLNGVNSYEEPVSAQIIGPHSVYLDTEADSESDFPWIVVDDRENFYYPMKGDYCMFMGFKKVEKNQKGSMGQIPTNLSALASKSKKTTYWKFFNKVAGVDLSLSEWEKIFSKKYHNMLKVEFPSSDGYFCCHDEISFIVDGVYHCLRRGVEDKLIYDRVSLDLSSYLNYEENPINKI